jgi:F0F1-type ATP synthase assembly protein I
MAKPDDPIWGRATTYGLEICAGVGIGAWVGYMLDKRFGWHQPWGVIVGCVLGLTAGMYLMLKDAMKINKD